MNIGLGIGIPFTRSSLWSNIFTPTALFMDGSTEGVWYDPSDIKLNWRRNLLTETEFRNGLIDAPTRDGLISATTLNGYQGAIAFGHDGVTSSFAYKSISVTALTTYNISVVVEMSDGLAPTFGSSFGSDSVNDFVFVVAAAAVSPITYSVKNFGGTLYRVSATYTAPGAVNGITVGIVKYATNSSRTFKVSAYQLELGSTSTEYQRITDGIQDYLTYQPLPVLYQDAAGTTPVTAVEQPVGLMLDKSKGLVLGSELVSNGDFSAGTTGWVLASGASISGGLLTFSSVASTNGATQTDYASLPNLSTSKVTVVVTTLTAGQFRLKLKGGSYFLVPASVGTHQIYVVAGSSTTFGLEVHAAGTTSGTIDNISVRELPGNHAYQTVSTRRPVLSARVNLLTKTEQFDDTVWVKQAGTSVSATKVAAPDGTLTAFSVAGDGVSGLYQTVPGTNSLGQSTRSIYLRVQAGTATVVIKDPALTQGTTTCNLTTLWKRFTLSETTSPTGGKAAGIWVSNIPVTGIEVAWPDLRVTNTGVNLPAYQRVNTATDYDTVGFPTYLKFDSIDDAMQTNSIDFTATDKMTVFAGVRKLSDAAVGILAETSVAANINDGAFYLGAPALAASNYTFNSRGTVPQVALYTDSAVAAPITNILTGISNISGDQAILRVNGIQAAISTADQGTGNYGNYPLYIGARAGTSLFFNGNLYQLIIAGGSVINIAEEDLDLVLNESGDSITAETTVPIGISTIEACERFVNRKTLAY